MFLALKIELQLLAWKSSLLLSFQTAFAWVGMKYMNLMIKGQKGPPESQVLKIYTGSNGVKGVTNVLTFRVLRV